MQEDVGRFDVPVQNSSPVYVSEGLGQPDPELDQSGNGHGRFGDVPA
jgi:hypothetical protein